MKKRSEYRFYDCRVGPVPPLSCGSLSGDLKRARILDHKLILTGVRYTDELDPS